MVEDDRKLVICPGRIFADARDRHAPLWDIVRPYYEKGEYVPLELLKLATLPLFEDIPNYHSIILNGLVKTAEQGRFVADQLDRFGIPVSRRIGILRDTPREQCRRNLSQGVLRERRKELTPSQITMREHLWDQHDGDIEAWMRGNTRLLVLEDHFLDENLAMDAVRNLVSQHIYQQGNPGGQVPFTVAA